MTDFNDHPPKFVSPPKNFTIRVPENEQVRLMIKMMRRSILSPFRYRNQNLFQVGAPVIEVRAVDTDIGNNGAVRFKLLTPSSTLIFNLLASGTGSGRTHWGTTSPS